MRGNFGKNPQNCLTTKLDLAVIQMSQLTVERAIYVHSDFSKKGDK